MIKNQPLTRIGKKNRKGRMEGDQCQQCYEGTMIRVHDRLKCSVCAYAQKEQS